MIHECSPGGPTFNKFVRECRNYSYSYFYPDVKPGQLNENGIRCETLEEMCFEDNSFDIFITQDVMEHIFNPDKAFKEIARVLKPDGVHIFTLPCYDKETTVRAVKTQWGIEYLLTPDYHGDPINSDGCLVVTEWGHNLTDVIHQHSQIKTEMFQIKNRTTF